MSEDLRGQLRVGQSAPEPDPAKSMRQPAHENGHFYSPVCDTDELETQRARLWPAEPQVLGVDFDDASHREILEQVFPRFIGDYDYPELSTHGGDEAADDHYYTQNSQFGWLDSRALFVLLRHWRPARVVEIGSGYSSLLMADVNRRFLDGACAISCVEPYPRPFLVRGVPGIAELVQSKVQDLAPGWFDRLAPGDVLFIDSSHVAKTGSDVNFLYFEVLPRLKPGVRIHIHDIHLPHEYQPQWVIDENRSWNEQYVLRALLMYSRGFRVVFGCNYAYHRFPELVRAAIAHPEGHAFGGGSIWIERIDERAAP